MRRRWLFLGVLVGVAAAAIYAVHYFSYAATHPNTDDASVGGDTVAINAKISARVTQVLANGDQHVRRGDLLVTLLPSDARVQADQAAAAAAQAIAAEGQVRAAEGNVAAADAALTKARRDLARQQTLYRAGAVAAMDLDAATAAQDTAAAQYRAAQGQLAAAIDQQRAAASQAQAQRISAAEEARETRIVAPADGAIADQVPVQVGQVVQPGQTLMTLVPFSPRWIDANFKETQLRYVRVGQPALVHVDLLNQTFHGHVERLGPATGAALSLLPPENATGNYTKVVQRVPVRVALDDPAGRALQVGLSVEVTIDTTQPGRTAQAAP
ncbi:MAG TPA: HlyD family secretion protein [bacterium]|nr:HlyD family secretion protein [bacterium]